MCVYGNEGRAMIIWSHRDTWVHSIRLVTAKRTATHLAQKVEMQNVHRINNVNVAVNIIRKNIYFYHHLFNWMLKNVYIQHFLAALKSVQVGRSEQLMLRHGAKRRKRFLCIHCVYTVCFRVWNALTNNYGHVMPVDWKTSYTRTLHLPSLKLTENEVSPRPACCSAI